MVHRPGELNVGWRLAANVVEEGLSLIDVDDESMGWVTSHERVERSISYETRAESLAVVSGDRERSLKLP